MKRNVNTALKAALFEKVAHGQRQADIAAKVGISESALSSEIYGRYALSSEKRARLARVLGKPVSALFPEAA